MVRALARSVVIAACGAMLLQFGGCVAAALTQVFFTLGPFLL